MKTRITELLGIEHPVIQGGMSLVSLLDSAVAISEAGGLGNLSAYGMTPDELRENIREIRKRTNKPFAVNIMEDTPGEKELGEVVAEERVPVVSYGKGDPEWIMRMAKAGTINMPTVGAVKHAIKAEKNGAQAIVVQGWEAGGHTGFIASSVIVPLVVKAVKIPVVAAGGFCDGRGLAAALALGAEGVYMGTRFAMTKESPIAERVLQCYLNATENDTTITPLVTGTRSRGLKSKLTELLEREGRFSLRDSIAGIMQMRRDFHFSMWQMLRSALKISKTSELAFGQLANIPGGLYRMKKAVDGDADYGWMPGGQVVGMINDLPTCREVVESTVAEAERILAELAAKC